MTQRFQTRRAAPEDAEACADILQEWIDETDWFPTQHPDAAAVIMLRSEISEFGFTLAIKDSEIAGFSCMAGKVLQFLYVRRKYRNRGVGKILLDRCKFAKPKGFDLWTFQKNTAARRFYEREGLVEIERSAGERNEEGLPDIRYSWEGNDV